MAMEISKIPRVTILDPDTASLGVIESENLPFVPKRLYWIYDFKPGASRGNHAHKTLRQLFILLSGNVTITVKDVDCEKVFVLGHSSEMLLIEPGYWRVISNASEGTILLVVADKIYDESDYIRSWDEFVKWKSVGLETK